MVSRYRAPQRRHPINAKQAVQETPYTTTADEFLSERNLEFLSGRTHLPMYLVKKFARKFHRFTEVDSMTPDRTVRGELNRWNNEFVRAYTGIFGDADVRPAMLDEKTVSGHIDNLASEKGYSHYEEKATRDRTKPEARYTNHKLIEGPGKSAFVGTPKASRFNMTYEEQLTRAQYGYWPEQTGSVQLLENVYNGKLWRHLRRNRHDSYHDDPFESQATEYGTVVYGQMDHAKTHDYLEKYGHLGRTTSQQIRSRLDKRQPGTV